MKTTVRILLALILMFSTAAVMAGREDDVPGSQDHPLFTRMPNFYLGEFSQRDYDSYQFRNVQGGPLVEGRKTEIRYWLKSGNPSVSALQICRNHTNAIKKVGGTVLHDNNRNGATMKLAKEGTEVWAEIACDQDRYTLTIVETKAMEQVITADMMLEALKKQGFIALDIHFDTGKATIKPESQPIIVQIVALMKGHSDLNLSVEGHTDSVGTPTSNKTLADARAQAVVAALVGQGVDGKRLSAVGYGQERPVADNRTEEGRAKNRRVELVKK